MRPRMVCFGLIALAGLAVDTPARAADFDKYLPESSAIYVQIHLPHMFNSQMVRKAVPMAFDKYGDQLVGMIGMAKGLPNVPEIPEEQAKDAIKNMAKPETIAQAFDQAKNFISDVIVAGDPEVADGKNMVFLVKSKFINAQMVEMVSGMARQAPQVKIDSKKVEKGTLYTVKVPDQDQTIYITVPETGILLIAMNEKLAEEALARVDSTAKPKFAAGLAEQITKRNPNDFVFVAGRPNDPAKAEHMESMVAHVVLDKDLSVQMTGKFTSEEEAKKHAEKATENINSALAQLQEMLGDKGGELKAQLEKAKVTATGKTVEANLAIPGAAVEKLLAKEK